LSSVFFGIGKRANNGKTCNGLTKVLSRRSSASLLPPLKKGIAFGEIKNINRALDEKIQELRTLFELSKEFNAIFDRDKLLKLFTFTLMGQVGASRYAVCLRDGETVSSRIDTHRLSEFKHVLF